MSPLNSEREGQLKHDVLHPSGMAHSQTFDFSHFSEKRI